MVILKEIFEKVVFEKISRWQKKSMKNFLGGKEELVPVWRPVLICIAEKLFLPKVRFFNNKNKYVKIALKLIQVLWLYLCAVELKMHLTNTIKNVLTNILRITCLKWMLYFAVTVSIWRNLQSLKLWKTTCFIFCTLHKVVNENVIFRKSLIFFFVILKYYIFKASL